MARNTARRYGSFDQCDGGYGRNVL